MTKQNLNEDQKKLLQTQHRLEEAQARNRVKERNARTRHLVQKGAILETAIPETKSIELDKLGDYLRSLVK